MTKIEHLADALDYLRTAIGYLAKLEDSECLDWSFADLRALEEWLEIGRKVLDGTYGEIVEEALLCWLLGESYTTG